MSVLQHAPRFTVEDAAAIVRTHYGLEVSADPLPSERDQNFRIHAARGEFILKIANATESLDLLRAQHAALSHLAPTGLCPTLVAAANGQDLLRVTSGDSGYFVRLLTWIPGEVLATLKHPTDSLFEDLGRAVATIDRALESFDHPAIHRDFYWDLAQGIDAIERWAPLVAAPDLRVLVGEVGVRTRLEGGVFERLRTSAIHNDANDHNVIVRGDRVVGVIDFGDMIHGWTVGDLAVAVAYAVLDRTNPIATAHAVVRGYEKVRALSRDERTALPGLVRLRLAMSVSIAAAQQRERPDDDYLAISQAAIRRTLPNLMDLSWPEGEP